MNYRLLFLLVLFSTSAHAQNWSTFFDSSRAVDWSGAGFSIPNYTVNCSVQPSLTANTNNSGVNSANATAIQNALASCDATHNVVNIPAGTYYVNGFYFGAQGQQVLRGAGPNATHLYLMTVTNCPNCAWSFAIPMMANVSVYWQNPPVTTVPGGSNQCLWTGTNGTVGMYTQGATSIILNSCGGTPPATTILFLDQADDSTDSGGIYICSGDQAGCGFEGAGNEVGRVVNGAVHSQIQSVLATRVSGSGGGPFTYTISPGVYFNNIRTGQGPGAWWTGYVKNDGLENLTVDFSLNSTTGSDLNGIGMFNCYQCWVRNIRSLYGGRNHVAVFESFQSTVRDSYFFGSQTAGSSQSYGIEYGHGSSAILTENNIAQQLTLPIMSGGTTGSVFDYNFSINNQQSGTIIQFAYYAHTAGNEFNLWEGNAYDGAKSDSSSFGASTNGTFFRNNFPGWQLGKSQYTTPLAVESWSRAFNIVGNVLGQPGYANTYEAYATSSSGGVNSGLVDTSVYVLGFNGLNGNGDCSITTPPCSALVRSTLMRWGNYDVVNAATQWNSTEASPAAVPYVNANFSSSYFGTLAHTLPASLYYSSTPSWWPSGKNWPAIGPDVSTGNVGTCNGGSFPGVQATLSSQCTGGTLNSVSNTATGWASHVTSIPAQDCYLNTMGGPPDGSGSVLSFDASKCYASSGTSGGGTPPTPPTALTAVVN